MAQESLNQSEKDKSVKRILKAGLATILIGAGVGTAIEMHNSGEAKTVATNYEHTQAIEPFVYEIHSVETPSLIDQGEVITPTSINQQYSLPTEKRSVDIGGPK